MQPTVQPHATAVVTGASGGIGRAIVERLVDVGIDVHALAIDDESLAVLGELPRVYLHPLDVRDSAALASLVARTSPDILVNNAGIIGELKSFSTTSPGGIDAVIDINLRAAVHATHAALPGMLQRDRGHVFFTGSIAGSRPTVNTAVYSATKAALAAFADGLRMDLLGSAVRTTVLMPGRVETRLYDETLGGHDEARRRLYSTIKAIQPADIASLVMTALAMPPHVDVTRLEVVPTMQVFGGSAIAE